MGYRLGIRGAAFSLLEVIIILVIAGIMASIAMPRYANAMAQRRADAVAWRIALDLSAARRQARILGSSRKVSFDPLLHKYTVVSIVEGAPLEAEAESVAVSQDPYEARIVSADFGGNSEVIFDGYGSADSGGSVVVQSGSIQKVIVLEPLSGLATVQ